MYVRSGRNSVEIAQIEKTVSVKNQPHLGNFLEEIVSMVHILKAKAIKIRCGLIKFAINFYEQRLLHYFSEINKKVEVTFFSWFLEFYQLGFATTEVQFLLDHTLYLICKAPICTQLMTTLSAILI